MDASELVSVVGIVVVALITLVTFAFSRSDARDARREARQEFSAVRREFVAVREEASDAHTGISDNIRRRTRRKRMARIMRDVNRP